MKNLFMGRAKYLIPILIVGSILLIATTTFSQSSVSTGTPPPDLPDFEGEPFSAVIDNNMIVSREPINTSPTNIGWTTIFEEDFENGINSPPWLNLSLTNSPYIWGIESINNPLDTSSQNVAWGVGSGGPELDPQIDGYTKNVYSWLVFGPIDMSNAVGGSIAFDLYFDADEGASFAVAVSKEGSPYVGEKIVGKEDQIGWARLDQELDEYIGESQVNVAFIFQSNEQPNPTNKLGALLDNIEISINNPSRVNMPYIAYEVTPTPALPTPTPTPTPNPNQDYIDNFEFDIDGWLPRRWSDDAEYNYQHRSDCDQGGRCGFLEVEVKNNQAYVIMSPLIPAKDLPYNIEVIARLMPKEDGNYPKDQAQYAIIFGGNWNGEECPAGDFSYCFTQYYELRVRFRDLGNDNRFLEYKLKRIDGHDDNNQNFGPDLIDWDKFGADPKKFVEWDITVEADGDIKIAANDKFLGEEDDSTYINNRYFGVEARTGSKEDSRVKFDYFKID